MRCLFRYYCFWFSMIGVYTNGSGCIRAWPIHRPHTAGRYSIPHSPQEKAVAMITNNENRKRPEKV
ncbi:hypothetical protein DWW47_05960 [Odoribacter splanchnicus]|uniref:Uncharacterized protein n=1 Tax=Odoribacter splanchnicus TaxID=28118 RepID=A0A413IB32_9BACT|nr:hypothetical protein B5F93_16475 [Odoribacter splanchnicus]RGU77258.1 hypothetical protein DWW47_05960 [Odoribacter splanchnicus]RGV25302.1 hypothetical protein DWW24_11545 [Odoribacter splanchnicus]RGY05912.1 hypothetical protein DXA53_11525 [Odoribacter splanchnicus]RHA41900.1 hypothetical protein DW936_07295 [Odoribacter splanchnicus]